MHVRPRTAATAQELHGAQDSRDGHGKRHPFLLDEECAKDQQGRGNIDPVDILGGEGTATSVTTFTFQVKQAYPIVTAMI